MMDLVCRFENPVKQNFRGSDGFEPGTYIDGAAAPTD